MNITEATISFKTFIGYSRVRGLYTVNERSDSVGPYLELLFDNKALYDKNRIPSTYYGHRVIIVMCDKERILDGNTN